jgi:hypothetical protein
MISHEGNGTSPSHSETTKEFVSQALALSDGGQPSVVDLFSVELESIFLKFEALLDERSKFANATAFLSQNFLSVSGADDNLHHVASSDSWDVIRPEEMNGPLSERESLARRSLNNPPPQALL